MTDWQNFYHDDINSFEYVSLTDMKKEYYGVDVPADVYTIPYAVKMILAAKARRDAGETLVLPRDEDQKGGAAEC